MNSQRKINTLGKEFKELQQRVAELVEGIETNGRREDDEQKQAWYSKR
ncbi:hypothetical protein V5735_23250 (plasmid) [Haladaptatus sp. SPP-AMP-3]